jgi:hypothetical protein
MSTPNPSLAALRRGWPAFLAGTLALALYARTLAPGLTWAHAGADGGDLLAAALTRGVPHPPGYPTYELLLRAAIAVLPGSPAHAGNWLSALCAAVSVALLADLARRLLTVRDARPWSAVVALAAGLSWAASPALWSQAVITEVYTLHALFVVLVLWLLWRWRESADAGWLCLAGLAWGLGLGNHLSLALMLPAAAVWWWTARRAGPARDASSMPWGELTLPVLALLAGLAVYAYLPIAAAGGPPVNWGDPRTPGRFWWIVSGRLYREMVFGLSAAAIPARLLAWAAEMLRQFGPWGAALAALGLWRLEGQDRGFWRLSALLALMYSAFAIGYNTADSYLYLLPVWAVAAQWLAVGLDAVLTALAAVLRAPHAARLTLYAALAFALALPTASIATHWMAMDLSRDQTAETFLHGALSTVEPNAIILVAQDEPTFALWYGIYGLRLRPDVTPLNVNLYGFSWYRATLAHHHPTVMALDPADVDALLTQLAHGPSARPLYRAGDLGLTLLGYDEHPAGALVKLIPR